MCVQVWNVGQVVRANHPSHGLKRADLQRPGERVKHKSNKWRNRFRKYIHNNLEIQKCIFTNFSGLKKFVFRLLLFSAKTCKESFSLVSTSIVSLFCVSPLTLSKGRVFVFNKYCFVCFSPPKLTTHRFLRVQNIFVRFVFVHPNLPNVVVLQLMRLTRPNSPSVPL